MTHPNPRPNLRPTLRPNRRDRRDRRGFTMIEVMASILLTSIVVSIAVAFQLNLGNTTSVARERLRTQRQAVALLDRISRDLAGVYFIAAADNSSRRFNPWIFISDRHFSDDGASDSIKFITRNYQTQDLDGHHSDLAVVAYYLRPVEGSRGFQLMRWRKAQMPQKSDPTFPQLDDPDADVIGENLASFQLSMIDSTGAEFQDWDSRQFVGRAALPIGVTITIAMLDANEVNDDSDDDDYDDDFEEDDNDANDDFDLDADDGYEAGMFSKTVLIPLRPLDWTFLESEARAGAAANSASLAELAEQYSDGDSDDSDDDDEDGDEDDDFDDDDRGLRLDDGDENEDFDDDLGSLKLDSKSSSEGTLARPLSNPNSRWMWTSA